MDAAWLLKDAYELGRRDENEACAKVAGTFTQWVGNGARKFYNQGRLECATEIVCAIRARIAEIEKGEGDMTLEEGVAALRKVTREHGGLNFSVEDWKAEREAERAETEKDAFVPKVEVPPHD